MYSTALAQAWFYLKLTKLSVSPLHISLLIIFPVIESYFDWGGKAVGFAQIVHPLNQQGVTELIPLHGMLSVLERGEAGDREGEQQRKKDRRFKVFGTQAQGILLHVLNRV